jgi:hypothetical protein
MIDKKWIGKKFALKNISTQDDNENSPLFWLELLIAEKINDYKNRTDQDDYMMALNNWLCLRDPFGIYFKNPSMDNMTALFIFSSIFDELGINPWEAWKHSWHPRDLVLYFFWGGNQWQKILARLFIWVPLLCMVPTLFGYYKIRPQWSDDFRERLCVFFNFMVRSVSHRNIFGGYAEDCTFSNGTKFTLEHHQADGNILDCLRLYDLKNRSLTCRLVAKLYNHVFTKKYGKNYMGFFFSNYFPEMDHPIRIEYNKMTKGFLE